MKLLEIIQTIPPDKARIIDSIMEEVHPGAYYREGLSWYRGGMADTGGWYIEKLAALSMERLQEILDKWREDRRKAKEEEERFNALTVEQRNQEMVDNYNREGQLRKELAERVEATIIWGKPDKK